MSKDILIAAGAIVLLAACSGDYEALDPVTPSVPLRIQASIAETSGTRVSDNGTEWESGDNIYLYGTVDGTAVDGLSPACYTYSVDKNKVGSWTTTGGTYYFQDTKTVLTLTAVYLPSVTSFPADGAFEELAAQDLLYASATTASYNSGDVSLTFKHLMAKVTFKLSGASGTLPTFSVTNLITKGSFDALKGTLTAGTTYTTLTGQSFGTAIFVYPNSTQKDLTVTFLYNSKYYVATISKATFMAGCSYEYTISV